MFYNLGARNTSKASSKVRMTRNDITEQQTNENGKKRNAVRFISFSGCHKTERAQLCFRLKGYLSRPRI